MYKKILKLGFFAFSLFFFAIILIWLTVHEVVSVQEIRGNPASVKGNIAVFGKVVVRDDNPELFLLSDRIIRCKEIPVLYKGQRPEADREIIIYGQFRKVDATLNAEILWWEYYLEADKIKAREDFFSGYFSYVIRQWVYEFRELYKKCKICSKLKRSLLPVSILP